MHLRALYLLPMMLLVLNGVMCEENTNWYTSFRSVIRNCPPESWNNSGHDEILDMFRRCVQQRALVALDALLTDDVIPLFDGLDLVRYQEDKYNTTEDYEKSGSDGTLNWTKVILNRLVRVLRSHVFKIDVDHLIGDVRTKNGTEEEKESNTVVGRRRRHRRRHHHMMPFMMMGLLLMGSILIPMGFQFLAVLGGKALLLAKMALILSSIQGLKKIATNGVNYGLYHSPVAEGWHERSSQETPSHFDLPYPSFSQSHH